MRLTDIAALLTLFFFIGVARILLVRRFQDPFGLFLLSFGVFYGFRAVLLAGGLDVPSPDYLFSGSNLQAIFTRTTLGLCVYLLAFICAGYLLTRRPKASAGFLYSERPANMPRLIAFSLVLTAVSLIIEAYLFAKFGGFGGLVHASKIDNALAGIRYLKVPCTLGTLIAAAAYLELRQRPNSSSIMKFLMLGCAVVDSVLVFSWGARSVIVILAAMVILGTESSAEARPTRSRSHAILRVALASALVVTLAVFLRDTRDNFIQPGQAHAFQEQTFLRRASQGVNGTYFDASMLAFRDWPTKFEYREGEDFWNGLAGSVPRRIWPDKPDPLPGKWFRQQYEPWTRNGWPVGAPTIWYLNFGWVGLLLGGMISGGVVAGISRRYRVASKSGLNTAMTFTLMGFVVPLGWESQTPLSWLTIGLRSGS